MAQSTVKPEKPPAPFRVHFADGSKIDVIATDPIEAREIAAKRRSGVIEKIKRIRDNGDA